MKITKDLIAIKCGLKYNKEVILDQDNVYDFVLRHQEWFETIELGLGKDHMEYGYFSDGTLYKVGVKDHLIERIVIVSKTKGYTRIKGTLSYDGSMFSGFQVQSNDRSVQGELEKILSEIHHEETRIAGASRTDAGVHALNQVFHFDTTRSDDLDRWLYYFHRRAPKDMYVKDLEIVHPLFHSRYDVLKKEYRYRINTSEYNPLMRNYEWFVPGLDIARLEKEMETLLGTHDFSSFSKGEKEDKTRTIFTSSVVQHPGYIELVFEGDGFLRYMIRLIVSALVKISLGKLDTTMALLLEEKSRLQTVHLAPAGGLYLTKIEY
ncbi:MAG: tRNA pseudouridine(38-40) synthase TruA [Candidatus Izemoplasmatales bacterium]